MQALCAKSESFTRLLDEAECYRQLRQLRWPDGKVRCPHCGSDQIKKSWTYFREPACHRYPCATCGRSVNDKTGTIFEGSKWPLSAWFHGFYLAPLSQSTRPIAQEVPWDYHTAHRIVRLVREPVLRLEAGRTLKGTVEADEIYITAGPKGQAPGGGPRALSAPPRRRGKKRGRGRGSAAQDSPAVVARLGREPELLVLAVVPDGKRKRLEPGMTQAIAPGSTVYTDSAKCSNFLEEVGDHHESVNHSQGEYVRGQVHENGTEGIWSLLLPWLATFRGVNPGNLPAYATFFQFLFNHRHLTAFGRSQLVLQHLLEESTCHLAETWQWPVEACTPLTVHAIPI